MTAGLAPLSTDVARSRSGFEAQITCSGAERVEISERFFRGVFACALVFVGSASTAALALLPLRGTPSPEASLSACLTALMLLSTPIAIRRAPQLYRGLRREPRWELACVIIAAILIVHPLQSQFWWPACGLLMLVATLAPLARTIAYCLLVLGANLAAHVIAGDLHETPTVTIVGLWVGFLFWSTAVSLATDQLASQLLRMHATPSPRRPRPVRVRAVIDSAEAALPDYEQGDEPPQKLQKLTFRQLQVVALLADGLRYAEIADCLSISVRQVQRHASQATARLNLKSVNELVAVAVADGLVRAYPHDA